GGLNLQSTATRQKLNRNLRDGQVMVKEQRPIVSWSSTGTPRMKLRVIRGGNLADIPQLQGLPEAVRLEMKVVAGVLPFKVNSYIIENLIDWSNIPEDPIFRLTFPHRNMLPPEIFDEAAKALERNLDISVARERWWQQLNPDPSGQLDLNVPIFRNRPLRGLQHKYAKTVLVFPSQGQTCHAYCSYCFRWPQFVGKDSLRHSISDPSVVRDYLRANVDVTDVVFTGGDPMVMSTARLRQYVEPLLTDDMSHVRQVRFGTKALAYWPARFTDGPDAENLLRLFERIIESGRSVAVMAHLSHPRELEPSAALRAVQSIRNTGAVIRSQAPVVRGVNDSADTWAQLWTEQAQLGITPYYMFIERNTGANRYFELPLHSVTEIYRGAASRVSGLARTAQGPVMSVTQGKIAIDGIAEIHGSRAFVCRYIQARDPTLVGRPFLTEWDPRATWYDDLRPFGCAGLGTSGPQNAADR
ncbi:KamA family radical SAM protein, partial [Amycolatopsis magusensis]|uniref:KamA family radical SAM protein n=1 Tax=Amycolatopsis magusensis TaxID=882444 RepID=UPI0024A9A4E2